MLTTAALFVVLAFVIGIDAEDYCMLCKDHTMCKYKSWDSELATVAQRWAEQCNFVHDKCRDVKRFRVGQSQFQGASLTLDTPADWRDAVESWYKEVGKFDPKDISPFKYNSNAARYTQLVWAESNKVGCGFIQYMENSFYQSLYICNYGPTGNQPGESVYIEGSACSNCTECHNKLCV